MKINQTGRRFQLNFSGGGDEDYSLPFDLAELRNALRKCKNTAAGDDRIPYKMIRKVPDATLDYLLSLFNRICRQDVFFHINGEGLY